MVITQDEENMTKIERHFQRYAAEVCWDSEGDFENRKKQFKHMMTQSKEVQMENKDAEFARLQKISLDLES